ncbi:hypothetical protein [Variovorax rhizosphaerae]|uniref:Uncharacterized protein n=1 Tax=Variovorax rhizosphaerae TaxID=1836200 RepID=A0ABU8WW05_9BURK
MIVYAIKAVTRAGAAPGVALACLALGPVAHADAIEDGFTDFSVCDAGFFRTLNRDAAAWSADVPLETRGDRSWPKSPHRKPAGLNEVAFRAPVDIGGMKALSYFDEAADLGSAGLSYRWGFMVEGDVDAVYNRLGPLAYQGGRLRPLDTGGYARTEIKVLGFRWLPVDTPALTPPGFSRTERALLIERDGKRANLTRVSCRLQGGVNAELLQEVRPDIAPADYPVQLTRALFDEVKVPPDVRASLDAERAGKGLWTPKFKRLRYTVVAKSSKHDKETTYTVEVEALQDGLLRTRETYDPSFNVQRLGLAGVVPLKTRMNGLSDGRVQLVSGLAMALPARLVPGEAILVSTDQADVPARPGDARRKTTTTCNVKEAYVASAILASIPGRAIGLSCRSGDYGADTEERVFLEDLGLAISLDSRSATSGANTARIVRFEVEQ